MAPAYRIDAFIAGAEKAGTTSLGHYLAKHPDVLSHLSGEGGAGRTPIEFTSFISGRAAKEKTFSEDYYSAFGRLPAPHEIVVAKNVDVMTNRDAAKSYAIGSRHKNRTTPSTMSQLPLNWKPRYKNQCSAIWQSTCLLAHSSAAE